MSEKVKKFKPQFLFLDDNKFNKVCEDWKTKTPILNKYIVQVEKVLNRKLTDKEKEKAVAEKLIFIENELKPKFSFPNATVQFNYDALGIILTDLEAVLTELNKIASIYKFSLIKGLFAVDKDGLKKLEQQMSIYTETEQQNEKLLLVNEGVKLFQKFKEAGLIKEFSMGNIDSFCSAFKVGRIDGELQIVGSYKSLKYIK